MKIKKKKFWTKNELFGCISGCDFKITIAIFGISTLEFIKNNFSATAMNILVYNLISLPQVTRLLLEDAIISSKTEHRNGSKKENQSYGEIRNNKTMLKILSLIRILYLRQQSNILRSFYNLKFEKKFI